MPPRSRLRAPAVAWSAALAAAALAAAPVAGAIAPPGVSASPSSPSQSTSFSFSFSATADPGNTIIGYEGGLSGDAGAEPASQVGSPQAFAGLGEGTHHFRVRAVQRVEQPDGLGAETRSDYATATILIDRTDPAIAARLDPAQPNGSNGWYRSLTIRFDCSDSGSGIASCPGPDTIGDRGSADQGANQTRRGTATDRVGRQASVTSRAFSFDAISPRAGEPKAPGQNAKLAAEPTFTWSPGGPDTSGVARYDVYVRYPSGGGTTERVVASVPHTGASEFGATRAGSAPAFPERVELRWFVRTIDRAGNVSANSNVRAFTIDSTRPAAPTITAGPAGPTNVAGPTFAWSAPAPGTFAWDVSTAGAGDPVQSGSGPASSAALRPLPEGEYTFRVSQVTAFGAESAEASRSFEIDLTPPPRPVITARPPSPAGPSPAFAWTSHPGTFSRWRLIGSSGQSLQGPSDTPATGVTLGPLGGGSYLFRVALVDAAGNASEDAADPFTVTGAAAVLRPKARASSLLPRKNASRLRPRAGRVVPTRSPVLSWSAGPKGTRLYNVQVFRVVRKRAGRPPIMRKVLSAFPRGLQMRAPEKRMRPSTCYVWRVWPYLGKRFATEPIGISHFCIASRKVLAKKAAVAAKRKGPASAR